MSRSKNSLAALAKHRPQKRGQGETALAPSDLEKSRQKAAGAVADAVSEAMRGVGHRQLSRRLGRDVCQTLLRIYREEGATLDTLADIAAALGRELVVELR